MKTQSRWCSVAVAIFCFVLASSVLQWLVDRDVGTSWPHNVLRNWQQYGIVALHGELVTNPGGVDALDHPIIYPGHRPMSLYPAYFVGALFAWTGSNFMAFHVVSALLVFLATWSLLGGDQRAFWVITLALLCPGYYIWPTVIDPNTVAALAGLPYAALLWWRMRQPTWAWSDLAFVFVLTLLFTALNWTSVLIHGLIFVCLLALGTGWRRLAAYVAAAAGSGVLIVLSSLGAKLAAKGEGHGSWTELLAGYTFGSGGYGMGLSGATLLIRLTFINALALLPLWMLWAWEWGQRVRAEHRFLGWPLAPVALVMVEILSLRNYFCCHPWMAAPLLLVAVLLSLFVLYARSAADFPNHAVPSSRTRLFRAALLVATFVFSGMVILARYEHDKELSGLITLVRSHTPRDAILTIVTSADPTLAAESVRLQELLDRPIRVVETFSTSARLRGNFCLTSGGLPPGWRLVARLEPPTAANATVMARALDWFSQHIARRKKGDKLELPAVCGLYRGDGEGAPAPSTAMPRALLPSAASPSAPKP